jgi:hypothetical protein
VSLRIGSLFSGVGGLELGLERAGLGHVVWQVEKDAHCRAVLARHWPDVERHEDVREFRAAAGSVDLICGGFPCQPWSVAGKRRGADDERHLWPEFARIIEEARPAWVVGENVPGLRTRGLRGVLADLARLGLYFIEDVTAGMVKIGVSIEPVKRLNALRTGHPGELRLLGWYEGTKEDEYALHKRFEEFRARREWFEFAAPIREYAEQSIRFVMRIDLGARS